MSETKKYRKGDVIFREGDPGDCMYDIDFGSVTVYGDYGGENETEIAKLFAGKVFGEMGMLDHTPRSATVVVNEDETTLTSVAEEDFFTFFEANPPKTLDILQQMCSRLRKTTKDYIEACHTVYDTVEAEKSGEDQKSESLLSRIQALISTRDYHPYY